MACLPQAGRSALRAGRPGRIFPPRFDYAPPPAGARTTPPPAAKETPDMNPLELALVVTLLTSCPDGCELAAPAETFRAAAPGLKKLALEWELLDAREVDYL